MYEGQNDLGRQKVANLEQVCVHICKPPDDDDVHVI